jgi:hypothetical protein
MERDSQTDMKNLTRHLMIALVACVTAYAFLAGATDKGKNKHQTKTPIMAIAEDGTTWIAGEASFEMVGNTLNIRVDLAAGFPTPKPGYTSTQESTNQCHRWSSLTRTVILY